MSDDDLWKREHDQKWRDLTDERIKNLTTDVTVIQDRLDYIEAQAGELTALIRGSTESRDEGINGDIREIERNLNRLNAVMLPDSLGQGGFHQRLKRCEDSLGLSEKKIELRWQFLTAIVVAVISMCGLLLKEWPEIKAIWSKKPIVMLEQAKHPKTRRHHVIIQEPAEEPETLH